MSFDYILTNDDRVSVTIKRLESYHRQNYTPGLWILLVSLAVLCFWASVFHIDQVAKASGEVIASSRVQIIQAVDGGVLTEFYVKEGDRVEAGQILARLNQTRFGASVKEIEARLFALKAKTARLRAEVKGLETIIFPETLLNFPDQIDLERALFQQRRTGLTEELETLKIAVRLAEKEVSLVQHLEKSGDVNQSEVIRTQRALNDAKAKLILRKNRHLEDASTELTKAEDAIAQNEQILTQRNQQLEDSVFKALVPGIVKNIRVTTVGGVLRQGEELMQIIPVNDELIIEAKVSPADIALIRPGLDAMIRFDPFDYTIYGGVQGKVVYVSADTLKEKTARGEETYYRVHLTTGIGVVTTTIGKVLDILPGMTARIDIRTGDRSVMEYLLKPVRKTVSDAFGEK